MNVFSLLFQLEVWKKLDEAKLRSDLKVSMLQWNLRIEIFMFTNVSPINSRCNRMHRSHVNEIDFYSNFHFSYDGMI